MMTVRLNGRAKLMTEKVLIVEDDPFIADVYRKRLSRAGYEIEVAGNGQAAWDVMATFRPDALVVDLMLPQMNGVALIKKVRASAEFKSLPIIVSTNAFVGEMIQDSIAAGATKVFNKSTFTPPLLVEVLGELLPLDTEETQPLREA